jgi:putative tryptophan/tyrosine transport system substrate-binding protein
MRSRREFITLVGAAVAVPPFSASAQRPTNRPLIAILNLNSAFSASPRVRGFLQALRELGYVEGRDFELAERYADGQLGRLSTLVNELVRLSPALFVTGSVPAALAVTEVSKTIPIVGVTLVDPVGLGLAESEARPGGQVTGTLISIEGLPGKQLAVATEVIPGAATVGLLINPHNRGHEIQRAAAQAAAAAFALKLEVVEAASPKEIDRAFTSLVRASSGLLLVLPDPVFNRENRRIAVLAAANRLPTMFAFREYVEAGGMMSYGVSLGANWRRAAYYVDRILRGTKPGDLPMELPTKLELVINLSTASAIGLTIPESFLLRADEVIE